MPWTLVTAPTIEPITRAELKLHLRGVSETDEDAYLDELITAARQHVEEITWRALINQTWDLTFSSWPSGPIRIPRPPLQTVAGDSDSYVKYYDTAGVQQTLATTVYELDTASEPGYVRLKYGQSWPSCRGHDDDIVIRYVAGYGAAAASVPRSLRQAIQLMAAQWFEHREPVVLGTIATPIPMTVESLLAPYRCNDFTGTFP
jgi:uncharacterized phiE125 gp8 family phage protein